MADQRKDRPGWVRYSGLGLEFAAAVVGFVLLGLWIDARWGTRPKGVLICTILGLVGGMYNFLRGALKATREAAEQDKERKRDQ